MLKENKRLIESGMFREMSAVSSLNVSQISLNKGDRSHSIDMRMDIVTHDRNQNNTSH